MSAPPAHIPPEWFLIHDDRLSEVRRLLETLGIIIADSLDAQPLGAIQNPAKDSPPALPRIKPESEATSRTISPDLFAKGPGIGWTS
jgi:hypothetical protein